MRQPTNHAFQPPTSARTWPCKSRAELVRYLRASPSIRAMQQAADLLDAQAKELANLQALLAKGSGAAITLLQTTRPDDVEGVLTTQERQVIAALAKVLQQAWRRSQSPDDTGTSVPCPL